MDTRRLTIWTKLQEHRRLASTHPLQVLILGPSNDGSPEYRVRCKVRDKLEKLGHNPAFGEDLHQQSQALRNPIDDLTLQADSADLIIMIYCSRGTQTERDVLLSTKNFAEKSIIFVEENLHKKIEKSLAGEDWKMMCRAADVIKYSQAEFEKCVISKVRQRTEELRKQAYARVIRFGALTR